MLAKFLRRLFAHTPATKKFSLAAESSPGGIDANRVMASIQAGRVDSAERELRQRLQRTPDDVDALHLLGLLCHQSGRSAEAIEMIGRAVDNAPNVAFIRSNFAEALRRHGDLIRAEHQAREAVQLTPLHPAFQLNLAGVLIDQNRLIDALEVTDQVLRVDPGCIDALSRKSEICFNLGRTAEALNLAIRARNLAPHHLGLLANLMRQRAWACDWSGRAADVMSLSELLWKGVAQAGVADDDASALSSINPFVCHEYNLPSALCAAVTELHVRSIVRAAGVPLDEGLIKTRAGPTRLRIGYVSADFHSHPTMHLMAGLFELHDRARFEIFAYSIGVDDGSAYRRRALESVDHFVDIRAQPPHQSAEQIRADKIDILVDLKGFTHEARPGIFALRPAPIQAAWLGYPASTHNLLNDYAIVDQRVVPPALAEQFREKLVWMPHSYQVNDHRQPVALAVPTRSELGLPESGFVYACFNQVYKIEPAVFAVWMRILGRVPGSVLWLYTSNLSARANLAREAEVLGISSTRILFGATLDKPRHLARLACADLFLDTGAINAHTSASDALWAGVPVLTRPGDLFAARVGASLVSAAGLPQLICHSVAQYEETAVRLANAPAELAQLRNVLTARERLPLFDTPRYARNLERAFEMMWARCLTGEPPASFYVTDVDSAHPHDPAYSL